MKKQFLRLRLSQALRCPQQHLRHARLSLKSEGGNRVRRCAADYQQQNLRAAACDFEALDIAVDYDAATKTITAKGADKTFELTIGSNIVKVNGEEKAD